MFPHPGTLKPYSPNMVRLLHKRVTEQAGLDHVRFVDLRHTYTPKKAAADSSKTEYKHENFTYNQDADEFICPSGKVLKLRCLQRFETGVFRECRTAAKDCRDCPNREKCLAPSQKSRKLQVNIFQEIVDKHHAVDGSAEYNAALRKRQIWCEGTFSNQKSHHNLKQLFRRGLRAAADHCFLSACAINLKRLVKCSG